jgi:hypothetical protein
MMMIIKLCNEYFLLFAHPKKNFILNVTHLLDTLKLWCNEMEWN